MTGMLLYFQEVVAKKIGHFSIRTMYKVFFFFLSLLDW